MFNGFGWEKKIRPTHLNTGPIKPSNSAMHTDTHIFFFFRFRKKKIESLPIKILLLFVKRESEKLLSPIITFPFDSAAVFRTGAGLCYNGGITENVKVSFVSIQVLGFNYVPG